MPSVTDIAYAAGQLDADGSICLTHVRTGNYMMVQVYIGSQDTDLIDWLLQTFGGRVDQMGRILAWRPPAPPHRWLELLLPYMKTKRRQAELIIEYKAVSHTGLTTQEKQEFARRSKELNGRLPKLYPKTETVQAKKEA